MPQSALRQGGKPCQENHDWNLKELFITFLAGGIAVRISSGLLMTFGNLRNGCWIYLNVWGYPYTAGV